jgi:hypothetical protein
MPGVPDLLPVGALLVALQDVGRDEGVHRRVLAVRQQQHDVKAAEQRPRQAGGRHLLPGARLALRVDHTKDRRPAVQHHQAIQKVDLRAAHFNAVAVRAGALRPAHRLSLLVLRRRPGVEGGHQPRLGDADGLLLHGLVDGGAVALLDAIELVDAAQPAVRQHKRARLQFDTMADKTCGLCGTGSICMDELVVLL